MILTEVFVGDGTVLSLFSQLCDLLASIYEVVRAPRTNLFLMLDPRENLGALLWEF